MHGVTRRRNRSVKEIAKLKGLCDVYESKRDDLLSREELTVADLADIGDALASSPENMTYWNMRKRIILGWLAENGEEGTREASSRPATIHAVPHDPSGSSQSTLESPTSSFETQKSGMETLNMLRNELRFNAVCLSQNPKSYASWFHRRWCLSQFPPDAAILNEELDLCREYLCRDERNFHCWAHWYHLAKEDSSISAEHCMAFVTDKLLENFSNYSAWHYRSILYVSTGGALDFSTAAEMELLFNAFYTDPDDQSAWFYHRWILRHKCRNSRPQPIRLCVERNQQLTHVELCLDRPFDIESDLIETNATKMESLLCRSFGKDLSQVAWVFHLPATAVSLRLETRTLGQLSFDVSVQCKRCLPVVECCGDPQNEEEDGDLDVLCRLRTMEPSCKWVQLACLAMRSSERFEDDVKTLEGLMDLDPLRLHYYRDMKSELLMRDLVRRNDMCEGDVVIRSDITKLYHCQFLCFVKGLDLSHCQGLRSLSGIELCRHLEHLNISDIAFAQLPTEVLLLPKLRSLVFVNRSTSYDKSELGKFVEKCNDKGISVVL